MSKPESMATTQPTTGRLSSFIKGTSSDYLLFATNVAVGILVVPFMIQSLGQAAFGLWSTIRSISEYLGLLDGGLSNTVPRFFAHYQAKGESERARSVVATSFAMYSFLGACAIALAFVIGQYLSDILQLEGVSSDTAALITLIAGFTLAGHLLINPFKGAIFGNERLEIANAADIGFFVLQGLLTVLALAMGFGLIAVASSGLISIVFVGVSLVVFVRRAMPECTFRLRDFDPSLLKELAEFGGFLLLATVFMRLILSTDNLVISSFLGVSAVASYAVAFQLINMARMLITKVGRALVPVYSDHNALGDTQAAGRLFVEISKVSLALATVITIMLVLFGKDLIGIWVGPENFVGQGIFWALCPFVLFQGIVIPGQVALVSFHRHRQITLLRGAEGILNLGLTLILLQSFGLLGVALGTTIAAALTTLWAIPLTALRELEVALVKYVRRAIAPQLALGGILLALCTFVKQWWMPAGLIQLSVFGGIIMGAYGLVYLSFFAGTWQRKIFSQLITAIVREVGS